MHVTRTVEIWVGVFVALGFVAILFVAIQVSNLAEFRNAEGSYVVKAWFGNVGGLRPRAQVSMAGVTVGRVESIRFDDKRYEALVSMRIDPAYKTLPEDTSASILTAGLLGEQYVGLTAGGSEAFLKEGDEIELTQSAVILEQLISRFLFNKAEEGKGEKKASADVNAVSAPAQVQSMPASDEAPVAPSDTAPESPVRVPAKMAPQSHKKSVAVAAGSGPAKPSQRQPAGSGTVKMKSDGAGKREAARPRVAH